MGNVRNEGPFDHNNKEENTNQTMQKDIAKTKRGTKTNGSN